MKLISIEVRSVQQGVKHFHHTSIFFFFILCWYPKLNYVEILLGLQTVLLVIMTNRVWEQENINYF